jgi:hypothetical protein
MDIGYSVMSIVLYLILFLKKLHCTTKMINIRRSTGCIFGCVNET